MHGNAREPSSKTMNSPISLSPLQWDWDLEHADRALERKADAVSHGATPFQVDRRVLKDVVRENMDVEVGRINFLSSGTFHKAYLITLADHSELVAGVARRFMPRLKTESEVATMHYLRENTNIPVPTVYHYDSNPYNRLGGEYILMSKAPGVPLASVFHSLPYSDLAKLMENLASMILPLFAHRFSDIGSLYFGPNLNKTIPSSAATPKATQLHYVAFPFTSTLTMSTMTPKVTAKMSQRVSREYHVGPIISWPFFGSHRGELSHPHEMNRGPWPSASSYFASCAERELAGVVRENEGRCAPHRLHLDPDEILSSRHHRMKAVPGDESDDSDEWDLEESEDEWEGPGDAMYRDYRRMQRSTFLIAHLSQREEQVRKEMARWTRIMERLKKLTFGDAEEQFGLDCHDLSLENIFVDAEDNSKITCIIDWESTTTRPLWQCAHLPAFVQASPFIGRLFRAAVVKLGESSAPITIKHNREFDIAALAREWLFHESAGQRLRMAHRFVEWDGWEEGLVDTILGPEEDEDRWFLKDHELDGEDEASLGAANSPPQAEFAFSPMPNGAAGANVGARANIGHAGMAILQASMTRRKRASKLPLPIAQEKEKEQMLNTTGDYCGGRGGELGRRLEAWLTVNGIENGQVHSPLMARWNTDHEMHGGDHLEVAVAE